MAATLAGTSLSTTTRIIPIKAEVPKQHPWRAGNGTYMIGQRQRQRQRQRVLIVGPVRSSPATPPGISDKVSESIKQAEEACAGDAVSGECAAAWDEVEELSAAASHARDKLNEDSDPLEKYCKDNPETDECRTYED